jgi:hypothetical protein
VLRELAVARVCSFENDLGRHAELLDELALFASRVL